MGDPVVAARLAKRFEPILLFHEAERFLPLDPKRYIERCALWRATAPRDDKANWTRLVERGRLAATSAPADLAGGRVWLGANPIFGVRPRGGEEPNQPETFLELAGWEPPVDPPVGPATENRHPALDPALYTGPFVGTDPWYYVEYLDNRDLRLIGGNPAMQPNGLNLLEAVATNPALFSPQALIYHFLYPFHDEPLEGCEQAGAGALFGSFAGEWASIAILLDRDSQPRMIGLTSRNTGKPAIVPGEERRIGMRVTDWAKVDAVPGPDGALHPKIFVSRGSHGHYLDTAPPPLDPVTPGGLDPARNSCGEVEKLDDLVSGDKVVLPGIPATDPEDDDVLTILLKIWVTPPPIIGIGLAIAWAADEGAFGAFGNSATPDVLAMPTPPADVVGGPKWGRVLRPAALDFPEAAAAAEVLDWNVRRVQAPAPDSRVYGFVVDRAQQPWWAPRPAPRAGTTDLKNGEGFAGRWGPRVTDDPNTRRCGMRCPDFALLFLEGVARALNR